MSHQDFESKADGFRQGGRLQEAIVLYAKAIQAAPTRLIAKEKFIKLAGGALAAGFDGLIEDAILGCLRSAHVIDCQRMQKLWLTHVAAHPGISGRL